NSPFRRQLEFPPRIDSQFLLPSRRSLVHVNRYPASGLGCSVLEEMATRPSMGELNDAIGQRYQAATELRERRQILAEFVRIAEYHRKHALRVLTHPATSSALRQRLYDAAAIRHSRCCGKRSTASAASGLRSSSRYN